MPPHSSQAFKVLQSRAVQCSFSSVFHVSRAGGPEKQARDFENVFKAFVCIPVALMGGVGYFQFFLGREDA